MSTEDPAWLDSASQQGELTNASNPASSQNLKLFRVWPGLKLKSSSSDFISFELKDILIVFPHHTNYIVYEKFQRNPDEK